MEADEKYGVSQDFLNSTHGKKACTDCHGGDPNTNDKTAAHKGVITDPSTNAQQTCGACHAKPVAEQTNSLHATINGFNTLLATRGGHPEAGALHEGIDNHCAKCHTTCGQCHVSRPTNIHGGLLSGHEFKKTPPIKDVCIACHATRVGPEFLGTNEGQPGDVHWTQAGMVCTKCHSSEMHGGDQPREHRYAGDTKECADCHAATKISNVPQHAMHGDKLACQVCHSVPYKNCTACHVGKDAQGTQYFKTEGTELDFKIGLNPLQSPERPYQYVVLRHVPATPDAFDYYAKNLQPSFDALPTWKFATPHNIQKKTPQNSSCNNCHGQSDLFLTAGDVAPAELEANRKVIVPQVPKAR